MERGRAAHLRLDRLSLTCIDLDQAFDAVDRAARQNGVERRLLGRTVGDDQLADHLVRNLVLGEIGAQAAVALDAEPRLQAARRIVHARVDDLAVARAGAGTDSVGGFEQQHFVTGVRQSPGDRETDHAGPDHGALDLFRHGHVRFVLIRCRSA
jgi:hypothetical protein